jgi:hypothetical protein
MYILLRFSFILLLQLFLNSAFAQCDVAKIVGANTPLISSPYRYDGFLIHDMPFAPGRSKEIHSEFIAFEKQTYKVIFCGAGFEEDVHISIYNKKKPNVLVAEQTLNGSLTQWIFEPLKSGVYDIVYKPASSSIDAEHKGCIIMLIGFKK